MRRHGIIAAMFVLFLSMAGVAGGAPQKPGTTSDVVKQGEFAAKLVSVFRWDGGVPKGAKESDYLAILGGKRTFKFEAEDYYGKKTDNALVRNYPLYGPFSGKGWVSGVTVATTVHFNVFIPLEGEYTFSVAAKGDGQTWSIADKAFKVSAGGALREVVVGKVYLKPGLQKITAELPPEAGIDYLSFTAPPLRPIEPFGGWRFASPLRRGELAEIAASLLDWEGELQPDKSAAPETIAVSEVAELPPGATTTTITYLGQFSAKKWVRAGFGGAKVDVPLTIDAKGVYAVKVRYLGDTLTAVLDGEKIVRTGKPYLDWVDLGLHRLGQGTHQLQLDIPASCGVDVVVLEKRKSSPADYMALVGLHGDPSSAVGRAEVEKVLTSLVERFKGRK